MTYTQVERQFSFERLEVWRFALEAMRLANAMAARTPRPYGELADQMRRASVSLIANLAEGVGKDGKDQLRFFRVARGSGYELAALVEATFQLGLCAAEARAELRSRLLTVAVMLTRLLQRQPTP